jgi:hypothetical protein
MNKPKSITLKTCRNGFCATLYQLIGLVNYCETNNVNFYLDKNEMFRYYNIYNKYSPWFYVFNDAKTLNNINNILQTEGKDELINIPPSAEQYFNMASIVDYDGMMLPEYRQKFNQTWKNNFTLSDNIVKMIESFTKSINFSEYLGVHIRGTDSHLHGKKLTIESIIKKIDTAFSQAKHSKIFVMSDEQEYVDIVKNIFKDKVFYFDHVIRSTNKVPIHEGWSPKYNYFQYSMHQERLIDNILLEVLCLSKCKTAMLTRSSIAAITLINSPELEYIHMDKEIRDHDGVNRNENRSS